ncbi:MAG TPA: antibiotic biosynthesis monooxygenase [Dehalococcoidia bacterium]|jgi:heme-degrading monooxygenase HmoA|nr:antibiotic biosynthesis monooxygenase [Dehalococcoidia bacterium]
MILEAVVLPVKPGQEQAFEVAFTEAQTMIASMDGYIAHELHRGIETPNHYLLLVQWEMLEAHTVGFRGSAQYERWSSLFHDFYDPFPEVEHYEPVDL